MSNVTNKFCINGKNYDIVVGSWPEQCEQYKKAVKDKDAYAMNIFHLPYVPRSYESIQSEINTIVTKESFKKDLEFTSALDENLLKAYTEINN
jgi:hypothetical protein